MPGSEDDYGNEIDTDVLVETVCEIQPKNRSEPGDQGEVSDDLWNVFLLPDRDLSTADGVIVDGYQYEFVGTPWTARNPRTKVSTHIEVTARRSAGAEDSS